MLELQTIRRITVYAPKALEENLIGHFLSLGSTGFTVTECRGKGDHVVLADPQTNQSHVRIELLVQPAVAEKIMTHLQLNHLKNQAVAACVETVEVAVGDQF